MATKTTRVVTQIAAQVTGAEDITDLSKDIGKIPDKVTAKVAADVTGDDLVDGLATDLAGLPATTDTRVAASVTGDDKVDGLATDLAGLPSSTTPKVTATVTGDDKVDALVKKLADAPKSDTFTVTANIKETGPKGGIKQVGKDIDEVKGKASGLATSGAGFASTFLGPFSNATGIFGDLAEQISAVSGEAEETGGKLKGLGTAAAGAGVTIVAGLAVDAIVGAFQEIGAAQAEVKGVTDDLTQSLVDNGGAWDDNAQRALIASLSQTDAFKKLSAAGIDYDTIMDGLTGKQGGMDKLNQAIIKSGDFGALKTLKEANALSHVGANSRKAAQAALAYAKKNDLLTDAQKAGMASADKQADGLDDLGKAASDAGDKIGGTTSQVKTYNGTEIPPKKAVITGDASDANQAIREVQDARLPPKVQTLRGDDTDATRKIAALKGEKFPPLEAKINVTDNSSHAQGRIQQVADHGYEAKIKVTPVFGHAEGHFTVIVDGAPRSAGGSPAPAPTLRAGALVTSSSAPSATYNITINGAVDKDGTARTLGKLLDDRARRIGPTQLGRRRR